MAGMSDKERIAILETTVVSLVKATEELNTSVKELTDVVNKTKGALFVVSVLGGVFGYFAKAISTALMSFR